MADSQAVPGPTMIGPVVIGYTGPPHGADYQRWVEEICQGLVKVDVQPLQDGAVDFTMQMAELPDVRLGTFDGSAIQFTARQGASAPRLYLQMPEATDLRLVHGPRTLLLESGQLALADAAQVKAQTLVPAAGRFRTFGIERKTLLALCPEAEDRVVQPLGHTPALGTLIRHYHAFAMSNALRLGAEARAVLSQHIVDLTALALGTGRDATEIATHRGLAAARLAAIKSDIARNLADPDLSVTGVASRHNITPRYIQMLFEGEGVSFTEHVIAERLARAHRMLADYRFAPRSISAIALGVGFGDISYFNRCFRRRYGMTPSDVREQARGVIVYRPHFLIARRLIMLVCEHKYGPIRRSRICFMPQLCSR